MLNTIKINKCARQIQAEREPLARLKEEQKQQEWIWNESIRNQKMDSSWRGTPLFAKYKWFSDAPSTFQGKLDGIRVFSINTQATAQMIIDLYHMKSDFACYRYEKNKWKKTSESNISDIVRKVLECLPNENGFKKESYYKAPYKDADIAKITNAIKDAVAPTDENTIIDIFDNSENETEGETENAYFINFKNGTLNMQEWTFYFNNFFPEKYILNPLPYNFPLQLLEGMDQDVELTQYGDFLRYNELVKQVNQQAETDELYHALARVKGAEPYKVKNPFEATDDETLKMTIDWINTLLGDDPEARNYLMCIIGTIPIRKLAMQLNNHRISQLILFHGRDGNDGKSTLANFIRNLIGSTANVTPLSIDQISSQFGAGQIGKKLLNIANELDYTNKSQAGILKALSGGDKYWGEKKHDNTAYQITNYATLLFVSNPYPRINDDTQAMRRRMVAFDFNCNVDNAFAERYPLAQIEKKSNRLGFLLLCMYMAHEQIVQEKDYLVPSAKMYQAAEQWFAQGADLKCTIKKCVYIDEKLQDKGQGMTPNTVYEIIQRLWRGAGNKDTSIKTIRDKAQDTIEALRTKTKTKRDYYGINATEKTVKRVIPGLTIVTEQLEQYIYYVGNSGKGRLQGALSNIPTDIVNKAIRNVNGLPELDDLKHNMDTIDDNDPLLDFYNLEIKPYLLTDDIITNDDYGALIDTYNPFSGRVDVVGDDMDDPFKEVIREADPDYQEKMQDHGDCIVAKYPTATKMRTVINVLNNKMLYLAYGQYYDSITNNDKYRNKIMPYSEFNKGLLNLIKHDYGVETITTPIKIDDMITDISAKEAQERNISTSNDVRIQVAFDTKSFFNDGYVMDCKENNVRFNKEDGQVQMSGTPIGVRDNNWYRITKK